MIRKEWNNAHKNTSLFKKMDSYISVASLYKQATIQNVQCFVTKVIIIKTNDDFSL